MHSSNTLYAEINCPKCSKPVQSGIGFRVGTINNIDYKLGDRVTWDGPKMRPKHRPENGNLKTIGYYECDNLKCESWADCYPEIQEALIVIENDVISAAKPVSHKPGELVFDIIEPDDVT